MENFAELMQRLLEIQSGGRQRSPELIKEDARLMDRLKKRTLAETPTKMVKLSRDGRVGERFKDLTLSPWSNDAEMQNRLSGRSAPVPFGAG